eukprot:c15025_g1_i1 orf=76-552(-)
MELSKLELTIISAEDLKDVRHLARMQTYVVAWIDSNVKYTTEVDKVGGINPVWKDKFLFFIAEHDLAQGSASLTLEIYTESLTGTKFVGKVLVPLSELQQRQNAAKLHGNDLHYASYPIKTSSGDMKGQIYLSYCWTEKVRKEGAEVPQKKLYNSPNA